MTEQTETLSDAVREHVPTIPREHLLKILEFSGFKDDPADISTAALAGILISYGEITAAEQRNLRTAQGLDDDCETERGYLSGLESMMRNCTPEMRELVPAQLLTYQVDRLHHVGVYYHAEQETAQRRAAYSLVMTALAITRRTVMVLQSTADPALCARQLLAAGEIAEVFAQACELSANLTAMGHERAGARFTEDVHERVSAEDEPPAEHGQAVNDAVIAAGLAAEQEAAAQLAETDHEVVLNWAGAGEQQAAARLAETDHEAYLNWADGVGIEDADAR